MHLKNVHKYIATTDNNHTSKEIVNEAQIKRREEKIKARVNCCICGVTLKNLTKHITHLKNVHNCIVLTDNNHISGIVVI